jgi:hypothetical protein
MDGTRGHEDVDILETTGGSKCSVDRMDGSSLLITTGERLLRGNTDI